MKKRVLFVVNSGKISPNNNGGASVYYSHLELIYTAGYDVVLLIIEWPNGALYRSEDYEEIEHFVDAIIPIKTISITPKKGFKRLWNALFYPEKFEYFFLNTSNVAQLKAICKAQRIDVVWTEWRWAALLACFAKLKLPVIYAHHDWEYKLAKLRSKKNILGQFHTFQKKRVEFKLVKRVTKCVSGSYTEAKEIEKISGNSAVYMPTTYDAITQKLEPNEIPNIVHLGGMGTTANRLGLERFLDVCWQDIKEKHPEIKLVVIGSLEQASAALLGKLDDSAICCLGFVKDLTHVMCPKDIHIIPWEYNTGTRTRLPLVLNYEQVLVATRASVEALPEIKHGENALLCENLEEMQEVISKLMLNRSEINILSTAAKKTFFNTFTVPSQLEKIKTLIETIT
ncbi:MAG: glycosyltransferase family 4 protein [Flavobacteriaceae bacterium]|nr:glycosyltransferase family 4 protein [Flavobacteriaceae bacterium]